jgi:hypothetical protein
MVLTGFDFRITCLTSAAVFALLSVVQIRSLPTRRADDSAGTNADGRQRVLCQWSGATVHGLLNSGIHVLSVAC